MQKINEQIKKARESQGLTQKELAEKTGISQGKISLMEIKGVTKEFEATMRVLKFLKIKV